MHFLELILIAIGLSVDTFAVSISTGLTINNIKFIQATRVAIILAIFQLLMPLIGWFGGLQIEKLIGDYDHWIAFILLSSLGIKMIVDSTKNEIEKKINPLLFSVIVSMGIATSIDALVVGVSLAFLQTNIWLAIIIIGIITFLAAMIGMLLGKNVNGKLGKNVEIIGGIVLIAIGLKILFFHL
jgi:putative Mn2+ efflux pump MntP